MECLLDTGYVNSLGVCDLDKVTLEQLYHWARVGQLHFLKDSKANPLLAINIYYHYSLL